MAYKKKDGTWSQSEDVFVKCPFFRHKRASYYTITCEGGKVRSPDKIGFKQFRDKYCGNLWRECSIARMLLEYYDREEDAG